MTKNPVTNEAFNQGVRRKGPKKQAFAAPRDDRIVFIALAIIGVLAIISAHVLHAGSLQ